MTSLISLIQATTHNLLKVQLRQVLERGGATVDPQDPRLLTKDHQIPIQTPGLLHTWAGHHLLLNSTQAIPSSTIWQILILSSYVQIKKGRALTGSLSSTHAFLACLTSNLSTHLFMRASSAVLDSATTVVMSLPAATGQLRSSRSRAALKLPSFKTSLLIRREICTFVACALARMVNILPPGQRTNKSGYVHLPYLGSFTSTRI